MKNKKFVIKLTFIFVIIFDKKKQKVVCNKLQSLSIYFLIHIFNLFKGN